MAPARLRRPEPTAHPRPGPTPLRTGTAAAPRTPHHPRRVSHPEQRHPHLVDRLRDLRIPLFATAHLGAVHQRRRNDIHDKRTTRFRPNAAPLDSPQRKPPDQAPGRPARPGPDDFTEPARMCVIAFVKQPSQGLPGTRVHGVGRAHARQVKVLADRSAVGNLTDLLWTGPMRSGHQVRLRRSAPAEHGLAGVRAGRDALHRERVPADRTRLLQRGIENRPFESEPPMRLVGAAGQCADRDEAARQMTRARAGEPSPARALIRAPVPLAVPGATASSPRCGWRRHPGASRPRTRPSPGAHAGSAVPGTHPGSSRTRERLRPWPSRR